MDDVQNQLEILTNEKYVIKILAVIDIAVISHAAAIHIALQMFG